jgi:hypothetical protein
LILVEARKHGTEKDHLEGGEIKEWLKKGDDEKGSGKKEVGKRSEKGF